MALLSSYQQPSISALVLLFAVIVWPITVICSRRYRRHLSKIPGPFFASISEFPRLFAVAKGNVQDTQVAQHKQYGPLVRVAPNVVSISTPGAIPVIYSALTKFEKSDFYVTFDPKTPQGWKVGLFTVRSERVHRDMKRPIASAYSLTTLLELEGLIDVCIEEFDRKMEGKLQRLASKDEKEEVALDLGEWLHWYAFDVILSVSFSKKLGFMENEEDIDGLIATIEHRLMYNATIGQAPWLHAWLFKSDLASRFLNMIPWIAKMNTSAKVVQFTARQMDRYGGKGNQTSESDQYVDLLHRFKKTKGDGEVVMSDLDLLLAASGNIFAGADTTAISLRSMFYYLMKNPRCLEKLQDEIDEMDRQGKLSEIITFTESNQMPYLQGCLKEAMRMHPAVGMLLERVVPEEGVTIADKFIPAGTVVGVNPWVVARDREAYGEDADQFRPERWTEVWKQAEMDGEKGEEAKEKVKIMERSFLAFGTGSRTCLGKNISLLEMNKLVPQIFRKYTLELVNPDTDWTIRNYWFAKQVGIDCRLSRRNDKK